MKIKDFTQGFTLIELAMVLFILGLLLSSFLAPLAARVEQQERNNTQIQLDEIKEVLLGYVIRNGRFPCPDCRFAGEGTCIAADVDDGDEDRNAGECKTEIGNLPWNELGVYETDTWGQHFTYRVSEDFADDTDGAAGATGCLDTTTLGISFSLCSDGDIDVWNLEDNTDADFAIIATDVPAIVLSHGKNYLDTPSVQEEENYEDGSAGNNIRTFVDKGYSEDATEGFDDMVIWISPHILRTMSVKAGILP